MQAWMGEAYAPMITDQPLHPEIGGHQLGTNPRFEWNDPPAPFAVPDSISPYIACPSIFFWGIFFETNQGNNIPHSEFSVLMEGNVGM